jgi:hypothetical protein
MAATQKKKTQDTTAITGTGSDHHTVKIDPTAPAGSENSLGAESVRDGRPSTDDSTVEAIDEVGPDITTSS